MVTTRRIKAASRGVTTLPKPHTSSITTTPPSPSSASCTRRAFPVSQSTPYRGVCRGSSHVKALSVAPAGAASGASASCSLSGGTRDVTTYPRGGGGVLPSGDGGSGAAYGSEGASVHKAKYDGVVSPLAL